MASRGINKVILVGNVGGDPETRYMPNGNAVTNITLATSETWKDKNSGEQQERTEWHRITFYQRLAEIVAEYVRKRHFVNPETKNIRIPNKAKNIAQVVTAVDGTKRWQDVSKSEVVGDLLETALQGFVECDLPAFNCFIDKVEESRVAQERKKRKLYQEQLESIERTIINYQ